MMQLPRVGQIVTERKERLFSGASEFKCRCVAASPLLVILLYLPSAPMQFPLLDLPPGSMSFGFYWPDRPYNVYAWVRPDATLAGLYCNVATATHFSNNVVTWLDLIIDVLITPAGIPRVLDEDEVPADLNPFLKAAIEAGKRRVLADVPLLLSSVGADAVALFSQWQHETGACTDTDDR
ncbi:MAG: DUF402 domain-containing protein [Chloroflexi bacterium]|nr:DUF402 domain-containing protein [Chloroflexota bacterium]